MPDVIQPTYHLQDVTQAVWQLLVDSAADLGINANADGIYDVFYGDQQNIPRTPAICVESGPMRRDPHGASAPYPQMLNRFNVIVMVYLYNLSGSNQVLNLDKDLLLDQVQDVLHADFHLSGQPGTPIPGLVTWSHCESIDPGYTSRGGILMRCGRISWVAENRSFLLNQPS